MGNVNRMIPDTLRCVGHRVSLQGKDCFFRQVFLLSGHDAFHCMMQWKEQFSAYSDGTLANELVYARKSDKDRETPAGFRYVGHLVSIRGKHCIFEAKLFPTEHVAFHCLKQWKEQHPYYADCTFTSEQVFVTESDND
jgi:hypothetical protein